MLVSTTFLSYMVLKHMSFYFIVSHQFFGNCGILNCVPFWFLFSFPFNVFIFQDISGVYEELKSNIVPDLNFSVYNCQRNI